MRTSIKKWQKPWDTLKCFFIISILAGFFFPQFDLFFLKKYSILLFTYVLKCIFDSANWWEICYESKRDDWHASVSVCASLWYIYITEELVSAHVSLSLSLYFSFLLIPFCIKFILFLWIFILAQILRILVVNFVELNHIKV